LIVEIGELNKSWLSQLEDVGTYFMDHRDDLTETKEVVEALELVVLNASAQTETTCSNLSMYKFTGDLAMDRPFVLKELYLVIDTVHQLRDGTTETLLKAPSGKFGTEAEPIDAPGDYRRLVAAIEQWRSRSDKGALSLAQLDVDRFAAANHRHGTQMGDLVADRIRLLIEDLVQNRGTESLVLRLGGAKYFALFEGAKYSESVHEVETVRQAIELTTFQTEMDELTFTLSGGIVRGKVHEPATEQLVRLDSFVREAKKSGRNRTMMEEDSKPVFVEPPKTYAEPRDVSLAPALLAT
jgi:diguanylate cyclase (GGDEF)-like protein